ncbi:flagellar hook-associated protein FlgK [Thalassotalea sp. LPB0316]|uniref:flagellar hook-associated protein FlgK n=1 Tax=Thalassotalea sp. LPB0316 TaxID=2769490 RepID=UPI001865E97B|nr:flagellar hook-associated protein FlgK [Thalassotalea sp. LPB0316]QOL27070.1 flagellar hook-associated protein FlgK [Thalassotalea sp. LPB0316]
MSVDLYQTGVSGLLAAQQQLATTSHNIANVNTEGYSRQRAEQEARLGQNLGGNYFGTGTSIVDIRRIYDEFAQKEQLINQTNLGYSDGLHASLNQLNDTMSTMGNAVMSSIEQLYQSMNSIADNPSNLGLRSMALNQAKILSTDFNSINSQFNQLEKSVNSEIEQIASQISDISRELAHINNQVLQNKDLTLAGQPNDLLDARDKLISELGQFTQVNTLEDQNGVMTVMIANGTTLVAGTTAFTMNVTAGDPDSAKTQIELISKNGNAVLDGRKIGGELGAKIEFRDEHLKEARAQIDRLALAISDTFNQNQQDGLDLNGLQGLNMFTDINSVDLMSARVLTPSGNAGTLTAQVEITDITQLTESEYEIAFDGVDYIMTDTRSGNQTNLGAPGSGTYNTAFGFDFIETGGAPALNDTFVIRPGENASSLMKATLTDGQGIAASTAVEVRAGSNNIGGGSVTIVDVNDPVAARANDLGRIEILENPTGSGVFNYQVFDTANAVVGGGAYTPPSQQITVGDLTLEIAGRPSGLAPNAPEVFNLEDAFGLGNGTNALHLTQTANQGILNNGRESFTQNLGISTSTVGSKAASAKLVADTADALYTQAYNRNQQVKGVNLDEEAANLVKFQQAYQASSKIISVANTIFDTLFQAAR